MKKTKTDPKVLAEAKEIGREAYRKDVSTAPCQSKALMSLIGANDGSALEIMNSFNDGKWLENEVENKEALDEIFNRS